MVCNATLNRFFNFHYLFPFVLSFLVLVHLHFLHKVGSNNPMGLPSDVEKIPFHPYYTVKDLSGNTLFFVLFVFIVYFFPDYLGDAENFKEADILVTPQLLKLKILVSMMALTVLWWLKFKCKQLPAW